MLTDQKTVIPASAFVAPTAAVVGAVTLGEECSVYYSAVLRGDTGSITVGDGTNIQDGCVFHADADAPVNVGKNCTIGHGAIIHGCTIGDNTLIGMGSIVLNGAVIGSNCIIGAGSLVTQGTVIPDGMMAFGSPARIKRPMTEEDLEENRHSALVYREQLPIYQKWEARKK